MKRFTLVLVAVLALVAAPALFAQNPLNTTAPGATQEARPGQTNNDLPNPGNPIPPRDQQQTGTYQEHGTVEGTAAESTTGTNDMNSQTGTSTGTMGTTTGTTTGTTNDMDTTGTATTGTTGSYNSGSSMNSTETTTTTDTTTTSGSASASSLPKTASNLPTVALAGILALFAAFAIRVYAKRNA